MRLLNKICLIPTLFVGLLTSCVGPETYHEKIKDYINAVTFKTSDKYQYYSTFDDITKVATYYFVYYNFQTEYCGLFMISTTGGLERAVEIIFPKANDLHTKVFMFEYYNSVLTFNGEGTIKPSTFHYNDNILFSDVIVADTYAQSHMSDYAYSMSLGVHLNLMTFESTVANSLKFTLKDLGFTSYYN